MGILPMSEGLPQTHGQDARAPSGITMLPSIGRYALHSAPVENALAPKEAAAKLPALFTLFLP